MIVKFPLVVLQDGETTNPWVKFAKQRVRANDSLTIVCTGQTGTGKTWGMIGFARQYNPEWTLDYCYFKASAFVRDLEAGKFKPGDIILYDECGIDLSSAAWQNELNQAMSLILQTMRHRRLVLLMTLPFMSFLQAKARKLVTSKWEALGYNKNHESIMKPRTHEYNGDNDKFYQKRLLVRRNKELTFCELIKIPKADQELLNEYEKLKKQFTSDLYKLQADKLEAFEEKQSAPPASNAKKLTPKQVEIYTQFRMGKSVEEISELMGCGQRNIYTTRQVLVTKGYLLP